MSSVKQFHSLNLKLLKCDNPKKQIAQAVLSLTFSVTKRWKSTWPTASIKYDLSRLRFGQLQKRCSAVCFAPHSHLSESLTYIPKISAKGISTGCGAWVFTLD